MCAPHYIAVCAIDKVRCIAGIELLGGKIFPHLAESDQNEANNDDEQSDERRAHPAKKARAARVLEVLVYQLIRIDSMLGLQRLSPKRQVSTFATPSFEHLPALLCTADRVKSDEGAKSFAVRIQSSLLFDFFELSFGRATLSLLCNRTAKALNGLFFFFQSFQLFVTFLHHHYLRYGSERAAKICILLCINGVFGHVIENNRVVGDRDS
mmetsp:Transcript_11134/g.29230  ORF Transcript_11134/g.29230 Transcript_11134/m.29230 type:complete len:210 (-) Transcript_11134:558-1187(-)